MTASKKKNTLGFPDECIENKYIHNQLLTPLLMIVPFLGAILSIIAIGIMYWQSIARSYVIFVALCLFSIWLSTCVILIFTWLARARINPALDEVKANRQTKGICMEKPLGFHEHRSYIQTWTQCHSLLPILLTVCILCIPAWYAMTPDIASIIYQVFYAPISSNHSTTSTGSELTSGEEYVVSVLLQPIVIQLGVGLLIFLCMYIRGMSFRKPGHMDEEEMSSFLRTPNSVDMLKPNVQTAIQKYTSYESFVVFANGL